MSSSSPFNAKSFLDRLSRPKTPTRKAPPSPLELSSNLPVDLPSLQTPSFVPSESPSTTPIRAKVKNKIARKPILYHVDSSIPSRTSSDTDTSADSHNPFEFNEFPFPTIQIQPLHPTPSPIPTFEWTSRPTGVELMSPPMSRDSLGLNLHQSPETPIIVLRRPSVVSNVEEKTISNSRPSSGGVETKLEIKWEDGNEFPWSNNSQTSTPPSEKKIEPRNKWQKKERRKGSYSSSSEFSQSSPATSIYTPTRVSSLDKENRDYNSSLDIELAKKLNKVKPLGFSPGRCDDIKIDEEGKEDTRHYSKALPPAPNELEDSVSILDSYYFHDCTNDLCTLEKLQSNLEIDRLKEKLETAEKEAAGLRRELELLEYLKKES